MQNPEILIIGAAIIDILARPVNTKVFDTGSYPVEDIHMTIDMEQKQFNT